MPPPPSAPRLLIALSLVPVRKSKLHILDPTALREGAWDGCHACCWPPLSLALKAALIILV